MITIENTLIAKTPIQDVYNLFTQVEQMAWAFPTTYRVQVLDQDSVTVGVKLKMGLLPLDNNLSMTVSERVPPTRVVAEGVATPGKGLAQAAKIADSEGLTKIYMKLDLEAIDPATTRIRYLLRADATGNLKRIYDAIIKGQRKMLEAEFIKNMIKLLNAEIVEEKAVAVV